MTQQWMNELCVCVCGAELLCNSGGLCGRVCSSDQIRGFGGQSALLRASPQTETDVDVIEFG